MPNADARVDQRVDKEGAPGDGSDEAALAPDPEAARDLRLLQVQVDEEHRALGLAGDAQRQI